MPADDSLLFIDANKYLDLYRTATGKELLSALTEQAAHIFVTKQIVAEVQRNKLVVAAGFLADKSRGLNLQTSAVPDHLFGTSGGENDSIRGQMKAISQRVDEANKSVAALAVAIMDQISRSEDEVSRALAPIFLKGIAHSQEELQRARTRKELGNPPGKKTDPIGDELTWEQLLSRFKGKKRLWIISGDGDYGAVYQKKRYLNPLLYQELREIAASPEIFWLDNIADGIKHFAETTGVKADRLPTPEKAEQIKKEEKAIPPLGWMSGNSSEAAGALLSGWQASRVAFHPSYLASGNPTLHLPYLPVQLGLLTPNTGN